MPIFRKSVRGPTASALSGQGGTQGGWVHDDAASEGSATPSGSSGTFAATDDTTAKDGTPVARRGALRSGLTGLRDLALRTMALTSSSRSTRVGPAGHASVPRRQAGASRGAARQGQRRQGRQRSAEPAFTAAVMPEAAGAKGASAPRGGERARRGRRSRSVASAKVAPEFSMWPLPMPNVPFSQEGSTRYPSKASFVSHSAYTSRTGSPRTESNASAQEDILMTSLPSTTSGSSHSSHRSGSSRARSSASSQEDVVEIIAGRSYEMSRDFSDLFPGGTASTTVTVVRRLGSGTFGSVYQTEEAGKARRSALKVFGNEGMPSEIAAELFSKEMSILMKLDHPGVVQVLDVLRVPGHVSLLMEYAGSMNLFKALNRSPKQRFSPVRAQPLFAQIASAIAHCHQRGVVHRDLKPENVVLSDDGLSAKVVDFGSADELKVALEREGTVPFVAPEVMAEQAHRFDAAKADVYSLGVLLLEMTCGLNCLPKKLQWPMPCLATPALATDLTRFLADKRNLSQMLEQEMLHAPFGNDLEDLLHHTVCLSVSRRWTASEVVDSAWLARAAARGQQP